MSFFFFNFVEVKILLRVRTDKCNKNYVTIVAQVLRKIRKYYKKIDRICFKLKKKNIYNI